MGRYPSKMYGGLTKIITIYKYFLNFIVLLINYYYLCPYNYIYYEQKIRNKN